MPNTNFWRYINKPWIAHLISSLAGISYAVQSWLYAHTRESVLDEGAYLLKGYLFVTGRYQLYQDYGFWSNHMPLSFYLPGAVQWLFGPGLQTGRMFAIFLGLVMLLGLWLLVRRLGGNWWATAVLIAIAINPVMIKMYSVMVTQVLIACMLIWTLYLVVAPKRSLWQVGLGAALAGLTLLTRINLAPLLPLVVLYVFWQHGRKAGWTAVIAGGLTVLVGHALFWPGILRMWAYWIPDELTPFLNAWRPPIGIDPSWDPNIGADGRILSFFSSFRVSFPAIMGLLACWLLWPRRENWQSTFHLRSTMLLSAIFLVEMLAHMWATLSKNYCVFCLPGYTLFFDGAGLALAALTFAAWRKRLPAWRNFLIAILVLVISSGIGFAIFETLGNPLNELPVPKFLLFWTYLGEVPGEVELGRLMRTFTDYEPRELRRLLPSLAGLIGGILILCVAIAITRWRRRQNHLAGGFGYWALVSFLLVGTLLGPSQAMGGGYPYYDCPGDAFASYQAVGEHLAERIPPGARVYWQGGLSAVPLLYIPGVEIYPPQVNGRYSYYESPETDALQKFGFWNRELADQWAREADYILIQPRFYTGWLAEWVNTDGYEELQPTPPTVTCREDTHIRIFRRRP